MNGHPGPLGSINPEDRTPGQRRAHEDAMNSFQRFTLVGPRADLPKGKKVILSQFLKHSDVIADMGGQEFTGFRQLTGSCVGVSDGDAIATLSAVQRLIADVPTKAFIPWWPYPYGRTRYNEGDRGQGEGAIDSVMVKTLINEGVFAITEAQGLPQFDTSDGYAISSQLELKYSDGAASINTQYLSLGKTHPLKSAALCQSTDDILQGILNGYPNLNGCNNYVGRGSIQNGVCLGQYDGRGGHSTKYIGVWNHEQLGILFLYWNQWAGQTYPDDGSGKPRCSTWVMEAEVAKLFSTGGRGETFNLSHLTYFPTQPKVLDWSDILDQP